MGTSSIHHHPTGWSIFLGILLVFVGVFAIAASSLLESHPGFSLAGSCSSQAWLIGYTPGLSGEPDPSFCRFSLESLYLAAAFYRLSHPVSSVLALTLVLASYIAVKSIFELGIYSRWRYLPGTSWFLVDGIVSLFVAALIWLHWPSRALWAIGTLVGVSLIMSGIARFAMPTTGFSRCS
jgi:uncharacterized membrane protein HdeD (DUF308 family)